ncbi:hypothetical protein [Streptomyces fradiae]|uniref:hypothetical protein n=1 Tax=Streptomyces fradiae TaxID=1906 RepID=UPI00367A3709
MPTRCRPDDADRPDADRTMPTERTPAGRYRSDDADLMMITAGERTRGSAAVDGNTLRDRIPFV